MKICCNKSLYILYKWGIVSSEGKDTKCYNITDLLRPLGGQALDLGLVVGALAARSAKVLVIKVIHAVLAVRGAFPRIMKNFVMSALARL